MGSRALKRIKKRWRKPRGQHSKLREKRKSKGRVPGIGYRSPKETRGLHPSGMREVYVQNINDMKNVVKEKEAIRIAHTIGKRKKEMILKRAEELKIKILNP